MSGVFTKLLRLPLDYPLVRGMMSYAMIWPCCSLVQEYLEHGTSLKDANWPRAARFSIFGTFFMSPVFYTWMKCTSRFFIKKGFTTALTRAVIEQVTYSPLAMAYFFFGMSLLEGNSLKSSVNEVREKFWKTYKIGVIFWPTVQTMNFYFISEKNRIVFVSAASFVWTVFLAHVKGKQQKNDSFTGLNSRLLEPLVENKKQDKKIGMGEINPNFNQNKSKVEITSNTRAPVLVLENTESILEIAHKIMTEDLDDKSPQPPVENQNNVDETVRSNSPLQDSAVTLKK